MKKNIILVGFMGVGKGRTGRELARLTDRFAVDTDDLIESLTKMKIRKIFQSQGEAAFRQMEQKVATWLENNVSNTIVSTGGGFYMVKNIKKLGKVVYLHSSVEDIISAIENHPNGAKKIKKRPLLQNLEEARKLYEVRLPLYKKVADYKINVGNKEISEVATELIDKLGIK